MEKIILNTKQTKEVVDITDNINAVLEKHGVKNGLCYLFLKHTTAGLTTAYLNSENELNIIDAFNEVVLPKWKMPGHEPEYKYEHTHHVVPLPNHIIASFLGSSCFVPVKNKKLLLGNFQRVVLVELNGPREREILIHF